MNRNQLNNLTEQLNKPKENKTKNKNKKKSKSSNKITEENKRNESANNSYQKDEKVNYNSNNLTTTTVNKRPIFSSNSYFNKAPQSDISLKTYKSPLLPNNQNIQPEKPLIQTDYQKESHSEFNHDFQQLEKLKNKIKDLENKIGEINKDDKEKKIIDSLREFRKRNISPNNKLN